MIDQEPTWLMISGGKRWRRYSDSIGQLSPTGVNLTMPFEPLDERAPVYMQPFRLIQELVVGASPEAAEQLAELDVLTLTVTIRRATTRSASTRSRSRSPGR